MQPTRPTLGHIVLFTLDRQTADQINRAGGRQYQAGEHIPGIVVSVPPGQAAGSCNLTLFPDGEGTVHITNVEFGTGDSPRNRTWMWPTLVEKAA